MMELFYLAKPTYGGWVTFTAHLALKHSLNVYKIASRTEKRQRPYGYGVSYRNVTVSDMKAMAPILITAIDNNYYDVLKEFPDGTHIVIHDPTEVSKSKAPVVVSHLKRFRVITIRKSVQEFLLREHGIESTFLLHPFYAYDVKSPAVNRKGAVSISRIDYDKHTEIIMKANALMDADDVVKLYGAVNMRYVHFKLYKEAFNRYYGGRFDKTFTALSTILNEKKYVVDMSVIKNDGGGTQYTFLEAIHNNCVLVINRRWVEGRETPFEHMKNCLVVGDEQELLSVLRDEKDLSDITNNAKEILRPHIEVDWLQAITAA